MLVNSGFTGRFVYDLSFLRGPLDEVEGLGQVVLGESGLGEHSPGFGPTSGGRIDQDGFLNPPKLVKELTNEEMHSGVVGLDGA